MPHEGDGSCIAREEILHREGRNVASRRNGECIAMQKKGLLERKTMSCGAESYE